MVTLYKAWFYLQLQQSSSYLQGVHSCSMVGLLDLPAELLEQIFLHHEAVEDMISLASSSSQLHQVLSQPRMWRNLLAKANMATVVKTKMNGAPVVKSAVNYSLFQMLMAFLKTADDPEELLILLQAHICLLHPGSSKDNNVTIRLPLLPGPHCVSVLGLVLLALTDWQGQGPTVLTARLKGPMGLEEVARGRKEGIRSVWEKARVRWMVGERYVGWEEIDYVAMSWEQKVRSRVCLLIPEVLLLLFIFLTYFLLCISLLLLVSSPFPFLSQSPTSTLKQLNGNIVAWFSLFVSSFNTLPVYALYNMTDSELLINVYARLKLLCICPVGHI